MSDHNMERSDSIDNTCPVCHDVFEIFGVGPCDHPVCYRCSTRMRVLCDQMDCPICRSPMPQVAFVYHKMLFKNINLRNCIPNRKFKIFFEDEKVELRYLELLEYRCKLCRKRDPDKTFNQLQTHMRREHQLFACDLCITHLKIFPFQRKFYTRQYLAVHRRVGDEDDKSYKGHPLCEFCDVRYNDNDELWKHLRKDHFFCHFCDQRGINEFYDQYPDLVKHFAESHFLCTEDECSSSTTRFTHAFASEIDLKAHKASVHSKNMSKAQSRETRTIELDFQLPPRRQGNNRGGDYDAGRNYERNNRRRGYDDDLNRAIEASKESANTSQDKPPVVERVPDSVHDFPTLNGTAAPTVSANLNYYPTPKPKSLEEDFPTLSSKTSSKPQKQAPVKQYSSVMNPVVEKKPAPVVKAESKPVSLGPVSKSFRSHAAPKITEDEYPALGSSNQSSSNGSPTAQAAGSGGWIKKSNVHPKNQPVNVVPSQKSVVKSAPQSVVKSAPPSSRSINDDSEFPTLETGGSSRKNHLFSHPLKNKSKVEVAEKTLKSENWDDETFELPDSYYSSFDNSSQKPVENNAILDNKPSMPTPLPALSDFPDLPPRSTTFDSSAKELKKKKKSKKENKGPAKGSSQSTQEINASLNDIALGLVSSKSSDKPAKLTDWFDNPTIDTESPSLIAEQLVEKKHKNATNMPSDSNYSKEKPSKVETFSPSISKPVSKSSDPSDVRSFPFVDTDNFPSLHMMSTSVQPAKPPPGFSESRLQFSKVNSPVAAPPGFKATPCPPPGFSVSYTYIQPPGFKERNLKLIKDIQESLSGIDDGFTNFKALSGQFRQGGMVASDYYFSCLALMGDDNFESIFPELLVLLPDISKQKELWDVHFANKTYQTSKKNELSQCQECGQVLLRRDLSDHNGQHNNFSDFPTLSTSSSNFSKVMCK